MYLILENLTDRMMGISDMTIREVQRLNNALAAAMLVILLKKLGVKTK